MPGPQRPRAPRTLLLAAAAAASALASLPAAAAPPPLAPTQQVTLLLRPADQAGLHRLARARGLTRGARADRLAAVLPQRPARGRVAARLRTLGLTVTGDSTWSVTAEGAADRIRALFGSARGTRPQLRYAQALPALPPALRGLVTAALGGDETRPAFRRLVIPSGAGYTGPDLRAAYGSPGGVPQPGKPVPTVATLQLAGWDRADLTAYAAAAGRPDPIASGQYTGVPVGRSEAYNAATDSDGDLEVALDQQAVLGTAPSARQRAYFAPNTDAGLLAILDRVRIDATTPGTNIVAFSSSWGLCEPFNSSPFRTAAENLLAALAASGVTSFAATGDNGSNDCGDPTVDPSVDYPASSPYVVAVGGTTLPATSGAGESGWNGSGGGCSRVFPRPSWQAATSTGCTTRALPDIAHVGDPATGYAVHQTRLLGGWDRIGGTSLSAPLAAAMLANTWASTGQTSGYGDIHPEVYQAPGAAFRDITSGNNGYPAKAGYDLVTGRGAPLWSSLAGSLSPQPQPYPLVAATRADDAVYALRVGQETFTSRGGRASSPPAVVTWQGRAYYVVAGTDRNVYVRGDGPGGWTRLGPTGTSCDGPGATVLGNTLHVGCRGSDGGLWAATTGISLSGIPPITRWTALGGRLAAGPAAAVVGGTLTWFVTGTNAAPARNLYRRTATSGYTLLPQSCVGAPGASTWGSATYVGCITGARSVSYAVAPFSTFRSAGGGAVGRPGFAAAPGGGSTVVVAGTDSRLWGRALTPGGTGGPWRALGGSRVHPRGGSGDDRTLAGSRAHSVRVGARRATRTASVRPVTQSRCPSDRRDHRGCRALALAAAAVAATPVLATVPAVAAPAPAPPPTQRVTLYLRAPDQAGLRQLAQARGLPRAARAARLAPLLPQQPARDRVAAQLRALGLRVTDEAAWSVTAEGRADRIRALFGSARGNRPQVRFAQGLPTLPPALRTLVTVAVGGDETRPAFRRLAIPTGFGYTGPDVQAAYDSPSGAPAPGALAPTVATLQLAGWDRRDLSTYAAAASLRDPVSSGQYAGVPVGRSEAYNAAADGSGDVEVALDQQAVLGVAPDARQRAYFAPNTDAGFLGILDRVRVDATTPGPTIVALSSSWGACEAANDPNVVAASENLLAALTASGVSSFAATGDHGVNDCADPAFDPSVDYPASSPYVVGVGGTTLPSPSGAGESGWSGSGGGCSTLFGKPHWQRSTTLCRTRSLPDIAHVADPATGYAVYHARTGGWAQIGGTSLASPLAAGMLANAWASTGQTGGYGDIHPAIYDAPASTFRDITTGNNGYPARVGYDLVTGRGAPLWSLLGARLAAAPSRYPLAAGTGTDGRVWVHRGGQPAFTTIGGRTVSVPSVFGWQGRAYHVVAGTDHNVYVHGDGPGSWSRLGPVGTSCDGPAAVASGGTVHVGCRGADGGLWVATTSIGASGIPPLARWTRLGGRLSAGPAVALVGGTVTWFVTGTASAPARNLYRRTATSGYALLPQSCVGKPGASSWNGTSYAGCVTADRSASYAVAPFSAFRTAGGVAVGSPGFAPAADGSAWAYVAGGDRKLWTRRLAPGGATGSWTPLGGVFARAAGAATIGR